MTGLRGVLFDLDGTLLDHRGAADHAARIWAGRVVRTGLADDPARRWKVLEARHFPLFERGDCTFQEQRRLRVRAFHPDLELLGDSEADDLFADYLELYRAAWRPCPGAHQLLDTAIATGYRVGVLTNGDHEQQCEKLAAIGLTQPGLELFASSRLGAPNLQSSRSNVPAPGSEPGLLKR
ncbi:MAG: HAD family hydrolase [Propionicimonas sp.]